MIQKENELPLMYSIGTDKMLKGIINSIKTNRSDCVLISVGTMVRNLTSEKKITNEELAREIVREIKNATLDLTSAFNSFSQMKEPPAIIFYLFDYYKMMKMDRLRPNDGERKELNERITWLITNREMIFGNTKLVTVRGCRVCMMTFSHRIEPEEKLLTAIRDTTNNRYLVMASRYPSDYHIREMAKKFDLVLSFTGEGVLESNLSLYVFGAPYSPVPFYPETHELFGDKALIEPKLTPKQKKRITEIAIHEKWFSSRRKVVVDRLNKVMKTINN